MSPDITIPFPIRDQRGLNSCVAMALVDACAFALTKAEDPPFTGPASAMFVHYNARNALGQTNRNFGVPPSEVIKAIETYGLCAEPLWPDTTPNFRARPSPEAFAAAMPCRNWAFTALKQKQATLIDTLQAGNPFLACLRLTPSQRNLVFKDRGASSGNIPAPQKGETPVFNHAMLCVGYDATTDSFRFRNSMGSAFGAQGHALLPASVLTSKLYSYGLFTAQVSVAD